MKHYLAALAGLVAFSGLLMLWRLLYTGTAFADLGLAALGSLAILGLCGGYRLALQRRKVFLAAALEDRSWLRSLLTGRIAAVFSSLITTAAVLPPVAYFSLTATPNEFLLVLALGCAVTLVLLLLEIAAVNHVRPLLRMSLTASPVIFVAGGVFTLVQAWFSYAVIPLPDYLDAGSLPDVLAAARAELPGHHWLLLEILSVFRILEATGYWLLGQAAFAAAPPLALFLIQGAMIQISCAKLAVDIQAFVYVPMGRTI